MKVPTNQVQLFDELGYWGPLPSGAGVGDFASQSPEASSVGSSLLGAGGGGGVGSSGRRRGRDSRLLSAALPGVSALSEPGLTDLARLAPAEPDKPPPTATPPLRDLKALICLAVFKIRSFAKTLAPGYPNERKAHDRLPPSLCSLHTKDPPQALRNGDTSDKWVGASTP